MILLLSFFLPGFLLLGPVGLNYLFLSLVSSLVDLFTLCVLLESVHKRKLKAE